MRALVCVGLIACGGEETVVEGDPLIQSTLSAQFNNKSWTPVFGFGRLEGTSFALVVGADKISCADNIEVKPRDGFYGTTRVPGPIAVGNATTTFDLREVEGGDPETKMATGMVQITAVGPTEVSAVLAFDVTDAGARYALNGAVTMLRCP